MKNFSFLTLISKTLLSLALTLFCLVILTFFIGKSSDIDPVLKVVGDRASVETYERVKIEMGLDKPVLTQLANYLANVVQGDLGKSTSTGRNVAEDLTEYFPATFELATAGILIGVLLGVPLGILAAHNQDRWIDQLLRIVCLVGYSVPVFWLGLIALLIFYHQLGWVAGPGRLDDIYQYTLTPITGIVLIDTLIQQDYGAFHSGLMHLILPASLLGYFSLAYISRMTRSFYLEELNKEYVTMARVKGASNARILFKHILPNVIAPILMVIGLAYAGLLEGAVLTESVFQWPGIGKYITDALFSSDLNAVLGGTLLVGASFVILNLITDMLGKLLDPRT